MQPVQEQHGDGQPHYSCELGPIVLELYPLAGKTRSVVRLGIRVGDLPAIVEAMKRIGADVVRAGTERTSASVVLRDPDGNEIAVTQDTDAPKP